MFGGPATSLGLSILADIVPIERRGRAMGTLMGAFSAASVFGVPAGLELARIGGWRMPFFAVAALGVVLSSPPSPSCRPCAVTSPAPAAPRRSEPAAAAPAARPPQAPPYCGTPPCCWLWRRRCACSPAASP